MSSGNQGRRAKRRRDDMGQNMSTQTRLGIQSTREQAASHRNVCLKSPPAPMWPGIMVSCATSYPGLPSLTSPGLSPTEFSHHLCYTSCSRFLLILQEARPNVTWKGGTRGKPAPVAGAEASSLGCGKHSRLRAMPSEMRRHP